MSLKSTEGVKEIIKIFSYRAKVVRFGGGRKFPPRKTVGEKIIPQKFKRNFKLQK